MKPPRLPVRYGLALLLILSGGVWLASQQVRLPLKAAAARATYYCPMHPTYTSDRPGDCPICYMKLVKREGTSSQQPAASSQQRLEDICYLHNCPKLHEGKICPMTVLAKVGERVTCPICGTHVAGGPQETGERKILYWTDPMIPGYKASGPGKSPMGMDRVPVYEEAARVAATGETPEGYAPILVTPQKQQFIGVKTALVEERRLTKTIRTVGRVMVDETRRVHVHPKVEGWVREIFARYEGDTVVKGQPLFSFYSPDFVTTQQEYLSARKRLQELPANVSPDVRTAAEANVQAARQRLLWWDITEAQIVELEQRGTPMETLLLTSPIDGIVLTKHVFPGEYMERGGDFYHLADLSTVWVDADLYEYDLPLVRLEQRATVELPHSGAPSMEGKVTYVSPTVKSETRTATARLEFTNPKGALRPGMFTNVRIAVDLGKRLVAPASAVLDTGTRKIVFVDRGQGLFEPREVATGVQADGAVEVLHGLSQGDVVVTNGNFLIDSESRLQGALEALAPEGDQHGQPR